MAELKQNTHHGLQTEFDKTLMPSWKEMVTRASYRNRLILACGFAFISQSCGNLVLANYGPTLYKALGHNTLDELILQAGWITVGIPFNMLGKTRSSLNVRPLDLLSFAPGACLMDRVGRKPLMVFGVLGACVCLIVETAIIASFASPIPAVPNVTALRIGVAAV